MRGSSECKPYHGEESFRIGNSLVLVETIDNVSYTFLRLAVSNLLNMDGSVSGGDENIVNLQLVVELSQVVTSVFIGTCNPVFKHEVENVVLFEPLSEDCSII